jgi:hypothetical protein
MYRKARCKTLFRGADSINLQRRLGNNRDKDAMRILFYFFAGAMLLAMAGCQTVEPTNLIVDDEESMTYLEPGLRPEPLLFPEYLFMEGYELGQHGRIPKTTLIGIDLKTKAGIKVVLRQFNKLLATKGWTVTKAEMAPQSFRLLAAMQGETLEIRAVQGTGATQVFILYQPADDVQ